MSEFRHLLSHVAHLKVLLSVSREKQKQAHICKEHSHSQFTTDVLTFVQRLRAVCFYLTWEENYTHTHTQTQFFENAAQKTLYEGKRVLSSFRSCVRFGRKGR